MQTRLLTTKPHFPILDGLRGIAALTVVAFHLCEAHAVSRFDQVINHGYLAVDFFFLLSGFVIGYAYDDRWGQMKTGNFFRRRLVRLQPLVVLGMIIGAMCYYFQASAGWPDIVRTPVWKLLLVTVIGCAMIPAPPSVNIRGWNETYPLDGPAWSLLFEYIANILYALVVRRFSKTALSVLVVLSALALVHLTVAGPQGDVIGGWSLEPAQLRIGLVRVMYPFFGGLLLFRIARPGGVKHAFLWCSLLVLAVLAMPRIGGSSHLWLNGLYESLSIILLFPLIIYLGAGGKLTGRVSQKLCRFLGDISYPLYITHYPLVYMYTAWVRNHNISLRAGAPYVLLVLAAAVLLARACLKWYDEPLRRWLGQKGRRQSGGVAG